MKNKTSTDAILYLKREERKLRIKALLERDSETRGAILNKASKIKEMRNRIDALSGTYEKAMIKN